MAESASGLLERFYSTLPEAENRAVEAAMEAAVAARASLFLVGGPVRDLMLGRPSLDIDVAVEGDIASLTAGLARATGRRVVEHGRFGTATLRGDGFSIDFARTRRETYARPGALPDVEVAGIEEDLARRDFSVNAIALRLTEPSGQVLDPYGGRPDLERRLVRVLHDRSFQDDATRMIRAARYAARLGFEVEASTRALIERDLGYIDAISGSRLRAELSRAFREESAPDATLLMQDMGVLRHIHPLLLFPLRRSKGRPPRTGRGRIAAWRDAMRGVHLAPAEELGYCLVCAAGTQADVDSMSTRLHLTGRVERALADLVRLRDLRDKLERPGMKPSDAVEILERHAPSAVWALGLEAGGLIEERCLSYLREWRRLRPALNGFDLQRLGVTGPDAGRALRRLRQARLDGKAGSRTDEEIIVRREFGGRPA